MANNPSILAISKAMAHFPYLHPKNIAMLSLGAGYTPRHSSVFQSVGESDKVTHSTNNAPNTQGGSSNTMADTVSIIRGDWGIKQWYPFLLDIILDGDAVTTEMAMHYLLERTGLYYRLDPM